MIRWDDLRILLALDEAGSLAGAAERLGVNKTTVLRRLDALEEALGVSLLRRGTRGTEPTDACAPAVAAARRIVQIVEDLQREIGGLDRDVRGTVTITAPVFFTRTVIMNELPELRQRHPELEVNVLASDTVVDLRTRAADIAVRNSPPSDGDFVRRPAGHVALALYAARSYVARSPVTADRSALARHHFIGFQTAIAPADGLRWIDEMAPPVAFRASDTLAIYDAARAGIGIALLPCVLADRDEDLVRLDQVQPPHPVRIWLVMQGDLRDVPRVRAVADWLLEVFARHRSALCPVPVPA